MEDSLVQTRVVRFEKPGAPDVLRPDTVDIGEPASGQVLLRQTAIGVNYLDTYFRSGMYPVALPSGCGSEAAGVVEAVGPDVTELRAGDRVAYAGGEPGAYAERRLFPAARLVKVPDGVTDEQAAALMMKGMTVEYLLNRCAPIPTGAYGLMYAAAGGVGLLAGQWARHLGARLIGVAAGAEKCALAEANGYAAVIDRNSEDVAARVKEITGGKGVAVAYDSVGKATFETTLSCLAPRGIFVSFGTTTGAPPPVEAATLQKHGSLYFTRPTVVTYTAAREELVASANAVFDLVAKGVLDPTIRQRYPLDQAAQAHADLEAGRTSGATILLP
jgi:NADPH2:quinone reductase